MRRLTFVLAAALAVSPLAGSAQATDTSARRTEMVRRVRLNLSQLVRERLQLSDEQARRLAEFDRAMEVDRSRLMNRERTVRRDLRREVERGDSADQSLVGRLLDEMLALHRQRLDLMAREQRELGGFLTPVQRAKYVALQMELHRRVQGMRGRGGHGGPGRGVRIERRLPPPPRP